MPNSSSNGTRLPPITNLQVLDLKARISRKKVTAGCGCCSC